MAHTWSTVQNPDGRFEAVCDEPGCDWGAIGGELGAVESNMESHVPTEG
jgi:hypothetical protein